MQLDALVDANAMPFVRRASGSLDVDAATPDLLAEGLRSVGCTHRRCIARGRLGWCGRASGSRCPVLREGGWLLDGCGIGR